MKSLAFLILLSFITVMLCGLTLLSATPLHNMGSHEGNTAAHHLFVYKDFSIATFSTSILLVTFFATVIAVVLISFSRLEEISSSSLRNFVLRRTTKHDHTHKLKHWIARFEHSPSYL
jgi:preprotein translocase subunit SecG